LNPTLVAASTLMMLLPNPKRLMLGYLLGALMTSITLGLVIVFSLEGCSAHTTFVVGALLTPPGASSWRASAGSTSTTTRQRKPCCWSSSST
jgi:hypothetical protein